MKYRSIVPWLSSATTLAMVAGALAADAPAAAPMAHAGAPSAMTAGLTLERLAKQPGVLFAHALPEISGKNLVVVNLRFPPKSQAAARTAPAGCMGHRHPGSVYVYVTQGTARLGVAGQPVQTVHTGESFFEPVGALHTVAESASATEPAVAIAVMIVPDGAPLAIPACKRR